MQMTPGELEPLVEQRRRELLRRLYRPFLRYDECLAAGPPISTGVIEGACRHLVKDRMDTTGACWRLRGAEAGLTLGALRCSDDLDVYWAFHEEAEGVRNHLALYRGAPPPTNLPLKVRSRGHLRLVNQPIQVAQKSHTQFFLALIR
jgi:hypothetical protein